MDGPLVASMPRRAAAHRGRQTSSRCIVPDRLRRWHHAWVTLALSQLRRYAVARSLFKRRSLLRALDTLGFVQADPIRAPARAQDLTLRHRVSGYRAGDLQQRYRQLPPEEAFFVNYGYVPRPVHAVLQRREPRTEEVAAQRVEHDEDEQPEEGEEADPDDDEGQLTHARPLGCASTR